MKTLSGLVLALAAACAMTQEVAHASSAQVSDTVISGTIEDWPEGGPENLMTIGDGLNHVTMDWSVAIPSSQGWFYGSGAMIDSDVAHAPGISSISQLTNAESLNFTNDSIGPYCDTSCASNTVGDFIVWRNIHTGFYGALRIDDIYPGPLPLLRGTWWFQSNGSDNFSNIPEPSSIFLAAMAIMGLLLKRHWLSNLA